MNKYVKLVPSSQEKITTTTEQVHYINDNLDCFLKKSTVNVDSSMKFYDTSSLKVWNRTVNNNFFVSRDASLDLNPSFDKEVKGTFIDACFNDNIIAHTKEELRSDFYVTNTLKIEVSSVRSSDNTDVMTKVNVVNDTGSTGIDTLTFNFVNDKCDSCKLDFGSNIRSSSDRDLVNVKEYFNTNSVSKFEGTNYILDILKQSLAFSLDKVDFCDDKDVEVYDKSTDFFDKEPILIENLDDLKDTLELLNNDIENNDDFLNDNAE